MSDTGSQYQITELASGVRFFNGTPLIGADSSLSVDTNLSVSATRIGDVSLQSQTIDTNTSFVARIIKSSQSVLTIETNLQVASTEILKLFAYLDGSVSLTVSATQYKGIQPSFSIESNLVAVARKIAYSRATHDGNVSLTLPAKKISKSAASLSNLLSFSVSEFTLYNGLIIPNISISSNFLIADIIRFTPNYRTPGSLISLLLLDNHPLTEQNRKFDNSFKPVFIENKNWNNTKSRYYKRNTGGKSSFRISWDWLPSDRESTIDKRFARDFISEKAMDPDIHTLTLITYGENTEDVLQKTDYNVFISSYSENLIRRDLASEVYFWNCSLELEEA